MAKVDVDDVQFAFADSVVDSVAVVVDSVAVVDAVAVLVVAEFVGGVVVVVAVYSAVTAGVKAVDAVVLHPHQCTCDISVRLGQKCRI